MVFIIMIINVELSVKEDFITPHVMSKFSENTDFRLMVDGQNEEFIATGKLGSFYNCISEGMANEKLSYKQGLRITFLRFGYLIYILS